MKRYFRRFLFHQIQKAISRADDFEISQIIQTVIRRYSVVYPDWEVMFLSLPKEPEERREQLEQMLGTLKNGGQL